MNILVLLIPLSLLFLVGAGIAFFWAVDHDQFDDMETPRLMPLADVNPPAHAQASSDAEQTDEKT
ncbi:MAG: cbb3-type cytochrome oxidase assembly protein CcoS [Proteobacteria bacterium]|nr:cbb3-type cytochrome oxidase assembly protein CcoS [Pseudomonadota bacterium]